MELVILSYLSGIFSGIVSVGFRYYEIKHQSIYFVRQLVLQISLFIIFLLIFGQYFEYFQMKIANSTVSWFWVFFLVSNISYYSMKILYEGLTGIAFFPTEDEVEDFIKRREEELK